MKRAIAILPILLAAPLAHAEPLGLSAEGAGALLLRDDPQGSLYESEYAAGARLGYDLGPALALPEPFSLHLDLLWYGAGTELGSQAVRVAREIHQFALPLRLGWRIPWSPIDDLGLVPYAAAGPAASWTRVRYRVADPGAEEAVPVQTSEASELQPGAAYGLGFELNWTPDAPLGLVGRIEALRLHRGPNQDIALGVGLGATF